MIYGAILLYGKEKKGMCGKKKVEEKRICWRVKK